MKLLKPLLGLSAALLLMRFAKPAGPRAAIDPAMQKILDKLATLGGKPIESLSPEEARKQPLPGAAVKALLASDLDAATPGAEITVTHRHIAGPLGDFPIHVYAPPGEGPFPLVLYFHGGGFVIASTVDYDASARALAMTAQAIVVAVDYHQAPEHKFPAAPDDAYAAYLWLREHAAELNGDPRAVAVAGESAGGNLATVVSMMARDRNVTLPLHQLLVYPVVDNDMTRQSYRDNANAKPLNKAMMGWFFKHYASPADAVNPYALPMKAGSLSGLPPATIITAEIDPLRSEGQAYAEALKAAGVPVSQRDFAGVTHEFFGMGAALPLARDAQRFAGECLKDAFQRERFRLDRAGAAAAPVSVPTRQAAQTAQGSETTLKAAANPAARPVVGPGAAPAAQPVANPATEPMTKPSELQPPTRPRAPSPSQSPLQSRSQSQSQSQSPSKGNRPTP